MLGSRTEVSVRRDDAEIARHELEPGEYVIGREPPADIVVEANLVSRRHARLIVNYDEWLIEDLGSSNGTRIGGARISGMTKIFPTQKISLGDVTLELRKLTDTNTADQSLPPVTAELRQLLPADLATGRKYELGKVVAQGGMGAILDARERTIRRTVAMKVILNNTSRDNVLRFIEEAQITGQLEHPNIVPIHELGLDEQDQPFYTMKFVKGFTLKEVLVKIASGDEETIARFPLRALLVILLRVCDAVAFANSKGVIHRDLKPENVMIGDFGEVLVMDWGLAKVLGQAERPVTQDFTRSIVRSAKQDDETACTMAGTVMGTPEYMAPEQANGEIDKIDARTDVYAIGAILYHILTLKPPVTGETLDEIMDRVRSHNIPAPTSYNSPPTKYPKGEIPLPHCPGRRIPTALSAIAMKALSAEQSARYQNAGEMKNDIDAYLGGFATKAEQANFVKQIALLIGRNKGIFATGFAAWIVITALAGWFVVSLAKSERLAVANEKRAVESLEKLHGTAPTFFAQANALVEKQQLTDALDKITYAVVLNPDNADYWFVKGNILESLSRIGEARDAYQEALQRNPAHGFAKENLKLCEEILRADGEGQEPSQASRNKLGAVMRKENRAAEAVAIIAGNAHDHRALDATWRVALKKALPSFNNAWLTLDADGLFKLNLGDRRINITDLSFLRGMPVKELILYRNDISDLAPLTGLPLQVLDISNTLVTDLAPLRGLKLTTLILWGTKVMNLAALKDMPLKVLVLDGCSVTDLSALKGMKLEKLVLSHCPVTDLSPLKGLPLKELELPDGVVNLDALRGMPLASLRLGNRVTDLRPLAGMPLKKLHCGVARWLADISPLAGMHLEEINLYQTSVSDLSPLRGQPIDSATLRIIPAKDFSVLATWPLKGSLDVSGNKAFTDLRVLRGKGPIEFLPLYSTGVTDITPLRGLSIKKLWLAGTGVTDLHPVAEIQGLEELTIPAEATDIEFLRRLPNIKQLDDRSPADFWKQYDAKKK